MLPTGKGFAPMPSAIESAQPLHCFMLWLYHIRDDFRFGPSLWETALLCNDVSYWVGASLELALFYDADYIGGDKIDPILFEHPGIRN